jgi:hypothetical protein
MTTKFKARFDGRALVPLEPVDLPAGEVLEIEASQAAPYSAQELMRAMAEPPHLTRADVDELERVIAEGQTPAQYRGVFDDPIENAEADGTRRGAE